MRPVVSPSHRRSEIVCNKLAGPQQQLLFHGEAEQPCLHDSGSRSLQRHPPLMTCSGPYFLMRPVYSSTPCIAGELIRCCSLISWLQGQLLALNTCEQVDKEHLLTATTQERGPPASRNSQEACWRHYVSRRCKALQSQHEAPHRQPACARINCCQVVNCCPAGCSNAQPMRNKLDASEQCAHTASARATQPQHTSTDSMQHRHDKIGYV